MFGKVWLRDMAERAVSTYVQTLVGLMLAAGVTGFDVGTLKAAAVAAVPAALAVVKAAFAAKVPGTISPASLVEVS